MSSKKNSRENNHKNKRKADTSGVRGAIREDHFAAGGSLAEWRGSAAVHKTREEKRNSRSISKNTAIRESQED